MNNKAKRSKPALFALSAVLPLVVVLAAAVAVTVSSQAQTVTTIHSFTGGTDGAFPISLIRDAKGNLYGATQNGGLPGSCMGAGCGAVFKLDENGELFVLHDFDFFTSESTDGAHPTFLVLDPEGNLYGTTIYGGTGAVCADPETSFRFGCGTVFRVDKAGEETVLYSFAGSPDGVQVLAGLIRDARGNLYGTTFTGGNTGNSCSFFGCGVVFKVDNTGKETVLYRFTGTDGDGANPATALVLDPQGNLYGTTYYGGSGECRHANPVSFGIGVGCGTVFKLDKTGKERVLYSFTGVDGDGANPPIGALVRDPQGNLYGMTYYGGSGACNDGTGVGCGTVFKLDTTGKETVLHSFNGFNGGDGAYPVGASLVRDPEGNLYGVTLFGGASDFGILFKLDNTGEEKVLYSFTGTNGEGVYPKGLILDPKGNFFGITDGGGSSNLGTVFKLTQ